MSGPTPLLMLLATLLTVTPAPADQPASADNLQVWQTVEFSMEDLVFSPIGTDGMKSVFLSGAAAAGGR